MLKLKKRNGTMLTDDETVLVKGGYETEWDDSGFCWSDGCVSDWCWSDDCMSDMCASDDCWSYDCFSYDCDGGSEECGSDDCYAPTEAQNCI